jgi:hypothetical protein
MHQDKVCCQPKFRIEAGVVALVGAHTLKNLAEDVLHNDSIHWDQAVCHDVLENSTHRDSLFLRMDTAADKGNPHLAST